MSESSGNSEHSSIISAKVHSVSMKPTLHDGQIVQVDTAAYRQRGPQRGDLILFSMPPPWRPPRLPDARRIARVIALPREKVAVGREVYINGRRLSEPYVQNRAGNSFGPRRVPAALYFVLGDNRDNSFDSHICGWLPYQYIIGKVI